MTEPLRSNFAHLASLQADLAQLGGRAERFFTEDPNTCLLPPIEEQREIVRRVESLFAIANRIQKQYKTAKAKLDGLTPALLAKAFRGELVPQDPDDESADKLLQRLRSGKVEGAQPVARRGRKAKADT